MNNSPVGVTNNTDFLLSPGEQNVYGDRFVTSLLAPYLKTQLMCSSTRFVYKAPNVLLGLIPVGTDENQMPIQNLAAVSSSTSFKVGRFVIGLILAIAGLAMFQDSALLALVILALGASLILNAFPVALRVTNPAGGSVAIEVSWLEANRLKVFTAELQNRVFADKSQIQHQEAQAMRMMQAQLSQMQLAQMQLQNDVGQLPPQQVMPPQVVQQLPTQQIPYLPPQQTNQ